jgi:hypothetical protein
MRHRSGATTMVTHITRPPSYYTCDLVNGTYAQWSELTKSPPGGVYCLNITSTGASGGKLVPDTDCKCQVLMATCIPRQHAR